MVFKKAESNWVIVLIAVALIFGLITVYIMFFGGEGPSASSDKGAASGIPTPPPLPEDKSSEPASASNAPMPPALPR